MCMHVGVLKCMWVFVHVSASYCSPVGCGCPMTLGRVRQCSSGCGGVWLCMYMHRLSMLHSVPRTL